MNDILKKETATYATHGIPIQCDIYTSSGTASNAPVVLYFHAGGLIGWARDDVPPWLVQVCIQRKWPLLSASYRLLPQATATDLLSDVSAAYSFAQKYNAVDGQPRRIIVSGSSGGFFAAALVAHHCHPTPLAMLSICGINTFRHAFFNSSTLITDKPVPHEEMTHLLTGPPFINLTQCGSRHAFYLDSLLPDGSKNPAFQRPASVPNDKPKERRNREELYDYYVYHNSFLDMLGEIDKGYDAPRDDWPPTVIVHGDADVHVAFGVSETMKDRLGDKARLFVANGCDHLWELACFIKDDEPGMQAIRDAVGRLDEIVIDSWR